MRLVLSIALLVLLAGGLAVGASSQDPLPSPTPVPPEPAAVPVEVVPAVIAEGVTIGGVAVGGMSGEQATAAIRVAFDRPLAFVFRKRRWHATPARLGARAYVAGAVARALGSGPAQEIELVVAVKGTKVRKYVSFLDRVFSRAPRDSHVRLVQLRPLVSEPRLGVDVKENATTAAIVAALRSGERGPIRLEAELIRPKVTPANLGPVIVIRRDLKRLVLYRGRSVWRRFGVATGQVSYPTPLGSFQVMVKQRNPWWYPPSSSWAAGQLPVPPGPGNPLGTRWMGLTAPLVGIHGTPDAASIGYSASHGCIRMRIPDAEWLFDHVKVGTPVFIVAA